jgi:hypothetical protein
MKKNKKATKSRLAAASMLATFLFLTSCHNTQFKAAEAVSSDMESIVCPQSYEVTMDFFSQLVEVENQQIAQLDETVFSSAIDTDDFFKGAANTYFKNELYKIYVEFYQDIKYLSSFESNPKLAELVSYLKIEDTENHLRKELVDKYKKRINVVSRNMQSMGYTCPEGNDIKRGPDSDDDSTTAPKPPSNDKPAPTERERVTDKMISSMRKVLAVTYQSCAVLEQKPLDRDDKNVMGIKEECCYEGSRGLVRHIQSLSQVLSTHHYLQNSYGNQCFNLNKSPLIYDFGGRPSSSRTGAGPKCLVMIVRRWCTPF